MVSHAKDLSVDNDTAHAATIETIAKFNGLTVDDGNGKASVHVSVNSATAALQMSQTVNKIASDLEDWWHWSLDVEEHFHEIDDYLEDAFFSCNESSDSSDDDYDDDYSQDVQTDSVKDICDYDSDTGIIEY